MSPKKAPKCGDWLKLVECLALKQHGDYGSEVMQGDLFRFLGHSAAEGYCETYSPRLKSRFWIKYEYLLPVHDADLISLLEPEVPQPFRFPVSKTSMPAFQHRTKEN